MQTEVHCQFKTEITTGMSIHEFIPILVYINEILTYMDGRKPTLHLLKKDWIRIYDKELARTFNF